jgi:hypothetical protein
MNHRRLREFLSITMRQFRSITKGTVLRPYRLHRRSTAAILIAALALLTSMITVVAPSAASASATPSTPPFTQCPAVGASPTCAILVVINADRTVSVYHDPSVGPYDGGDDTLVGVQNDSSAPVDAITVTGPGTGLGGLDGDGLCTYGVTGCPFGLVGCPSVSTGYEGPGTCIVTDQSLPDSAEIDFPQAGLQAGSHTFFSLEGALTTAVLTARQGHITGGHRTVEFVHGINGNYRQFQCGNLSGGFQAILQQLCAQSSQFTVDSFPYYQDQGYAPGRLQPCSPSLADPDKNTGKLYVDPDSIDPTICDSKGALAYSTAALDEHLASLSGPVSVVANSMGGAITRGWLTLAASNGSSDKSLSNADSVVFLQGAQEGSWASGVGQLLSNYPNPIVDQIVQEGTYLANLDVNRPGVMDVAPLSPWYQSVNPSGVPSQLAYYNFYSALSLQLQVNFGLVKLDEGSFNAGDLVMLPGSDKPTAMPLTGGARFLPGGAQTTNRHQFTMAGQVNINPLDFADPKLLGRDLQRVLASPLTHFNFSTHTDQVMVTGCGPGSPQASAASEVLRILQNPTGGCS